MAKRRHPVKYTAVWVKDRKCYVKAHIAVVEKILGKPLPVGCEIHHLDGNGLNNKPSNLVVCPSPAYHKLLHRRQAALDATGNPASEKCVFCKKWGLPSDMFHLQKPDRPSKTYWHKECKRPSRAKTSLSDRR